MVELKFCSTRSQSFSEELPSNWRFQTHSNENKSGSRAPQAVIQNSAGSCGVATEPPEWDASPSLDSAGIGSAPRSPSSNNSPPHKGVAATTAKPTTTCAVT
ncbi:hypothetical protein PIB30_036086 [Stylosanthes scabra]|uniref:Uncharacterized protein n=1 Tax=Stylosanthes scabra TaxID=79078 RepID=A0ABU6SD50_9FABA|nr:hypothetical protein [Stylosanthes scabra]